LSGKEAPAVARSPTRSPGPHRTLLGPKVGFAECTVASTSFTLGFKRKEMSVASAPAIRGLLNADSTEHTQATRVHQAVVREIARS
jgi:hypothetical protein